LWHIDTLLGNDREISSYRISVARQRPCKQTLTQQFYCKRGMVFFTRFFPWYYKQNKLENWLVNEWFNLRTAAFSCCELLLLEAGSWDRWQFGDLEEGERPPLEVATKQRLVKTVADLRRASVSCSASYTVTAKCILIVTSFNGSINPITNTNPVYIHSIRLLYICTYVQKREQLKQEQNSDNCLFDTALTLMETKYNHDHVHHYI
jgi:hypothetical protein